MPLPAILLPRAVSLCLALPRAVSLRLAQGAQGVVELDLKSTPMAARANAVVRQGLSRAVVTLHVLRPPHGEMHDASVHSPLAPPVARTVQGSHTLSESNG